MNTDQKDKVTAEEIDRLLNEATTEEHVFFGKELLVSYQLKCGFTVTGRAACVSPSNFSLEIGRQIARKNAADQLWQLEGYRLQWDLFESRQTEATP